MVLQLIYICKFFHWETGYFSTLDVMHFRAGYYLCWGCLVWVPSVYNTSSYFLVKHSLDVKVEVAALILALGILAIYINYDADR